MTKKLGIIVKLRAAAEMGVFTLGMLLAEDYTAEERLERLVGKALKLGLLKRTRSLSGSPEGLELRDDRMAAL